MPVQGLAPLKIYLSSSFSARDSGADSLMDLRRALQQRAAHHGFDVVLGEDDALIQASPGNDMLIMERCAQLIGESDAFFGMAFERHGSAIALERDPMMVRAKVSFFEAELLEACFKSLPCHVVRIRELPPGPALQDFLRLVQPTLGQDLCEVDRAAVPSHFDDFCRSLKAGAPRPSPWLFDPVSLYRLWRNRRRELRDPRLGFLGGILREDGAGDVDEAVIRTALKRIDHGFDDGGKPLGHIAKLSYLWIAMRELARAPASVRFDDLSIQTQRTLGHWNSSAAWHGLHGSHPMGCLAALNELAHARLVAQEDNPPNHPRASAYYSVGARAQSRAIARRFFNQSFSLCQAGLARKDADRVTLLQQRASVDARLAALGEPWRFFRALDDYKFTLDARTRGHFRDAQIGESQTEYAYALFRLPHKRQEALNLAREGLALLRAEASANGIALYCRGARKYAEMLEASGRRDEALVVAREAHEVADAVQAFDQSRQIRPMIERLSL